MIVVFELQKQQQKEMKWNEIASHNFPALIQSIPIYFMRQKMKKNNGVVYLLMFTIMFECVTIS